MPAGLELLNLHAQGGMAEVYRARATDESGRTWHYAVKRILPELVEDPETRRMFIEEQRVAACLVHDNIVRVYDVAHVDAAMADAAMADASDQASEIFIVMEFLEGKDLAEVIEAAKAAKRTVPVWFAIHIAREICKALQHATTEAKDKRGRVLGLIHRDISPHNIFVCLDGQVKLTDFGVARVDTAEVRTRAGIIKGKFGYMSPEQLMGGQLDFRSDLYNVGILLYEMLTGERLFFGETATQFVAAMMLNEVPDLDDKLLVPAELDAMMRRALARKREERPTTAAMFERDLAALAAQFGLVATRAHIAGEMATLFPELAVADLADLADPASTNVVPDPADETAEATLIRPPRAATVPRILTMMSAAPVAGVSSDEPVFTKAVTKARQPLTPSVERALVAPTDDDLVPTLLEKGPTAAELELVDDDAPLLTEQVRPFGAVSSTAPGMLGAPRSPEPSGAAEDSIDGDAVTAETRNPLHRPLHQSAQTPASRPHRISTGASRRVVSLEQTDENSALKPRKPK